MSREAPLILDGQSLTVLDVVDVARKSRKVQLAPDAVVRMNESLAFVDGLIQNDGEPVYGINTGLGVFANRRISIGDAAQLSRNLVLSHAVGVGSPFPEEVVRAAMLIRANSLTVGHSGVRPVIVETLLALLNAGVYPFVPEQGSLGSSGDLAPLSHLALSFTDGPDGETGQAFLNGALVSGREALAAAGIDRLALGPKEGLALTNGTAFSAALATLALADATRLIDHAELATAFVYEALLGLAVALDERLHRARRHDGQQRVAARMRRLLQGSTLVDSEPRVQDAYSLRCAPQILGPVRDIVSFVAGWIENEINAVTDNPLIFSEGPKGMQAVSGGNFHGEVLAFAADYLGIAMAEVAALAERQINRLIHPAYSFGLPSMLARHSEGAGLNSGLMMPHYTAVSLTMENRTLAAPDTVHSMPVSAGQEDLNANSQTAARHLRTIVENTENVLAALLFTAAQALDLRLAQKPGLKPSPAVGRAHEIIRQQVATVDRDRLYPPDLDRIRGLMRSGALDG